MAGNGWANLTGKKLKVVFDDGEHISTKTGVLLIATDQFIILKTQAGEDIIALSRIIRAEKIERFVI